MIIFFYFDLYKLLPEFSIKKVVHQPVQSPLRQLPPLGGAAEHCFTKSRKNENFTFVQFCASYNSLPLNLKFLYVFRVLPIKP